MKTQFGFHWVLPVSELHNGSSLALLNVASGEGLKGRVMMMPLALKQRSSVASRGKKNTKKKGPKVSRGGLVREARAGRIECNMGLEVEGKAEGTGVEWARKPRKLLAGRRAGT